MASTNGFRVKDGIVQSYPKEDKLVIPDNVHTLTSVFAYDDFIKSVKIPSSVTRIGESAFYDCDDLNDVTIPGSVRTIEKDAFGCCGGLKRVVLEEGVVELKERVFEACPLTEITLPKSLRCVGLSSLGDFEIPTDENGMQIMDGILFSVPKSVKGHFMIPDGVRVIGSDVFAGCEALTQITIPQSVVSISDNAFAGCSALKTVALPEGLEYVGVQAFAGCSSLESIALPEGVQYIGARAFGTYMMVTKHPDEYYTCEKLKRAVLPTQLGSVPARLFSGCCALEAVSLPNTATEIEDGAFSGCVALKGLWMPTQLKRIKDYAFAGCRSLVQLDIPNTVTEIGNGAFEDCSALKELRLPARLQKIGDSAFQSCHSLTQLDIPDTVTEVGCQAFEDCAAAAPVGDFLMLGGVLLRYCGNGGDVTVPDGVFLIADGAFQECETVTGVTMPDSVKSVGCAFSNCKNLKSVKYSGNVSVIRSRTFSSCGALTDVALPAGLQVIEEGAFWGCNNLHTIALPPHFVRIEADAFVRCTKLQTVLLSEQIGSVDAKAFPKSKKLTFVLPDQLARQKDALPPVLCGYHIQASDESLVWLCLRQHGSAWEAWAEGLEIADPSVWLEQMIAVLGQIKPFDKKTAIYAAWFIKKHWHTLSPEHIRALLTFYQGIQSADLDDLFKDPAFSSSMSGTAGQQKPVQSEERATVKLETLAREKLAQTPSDPEAVKAVKKGIHWKDSTELCSKDVLICLLNWSAREWNRCAAVVQGEMNTRTVLYDGTKVQIDAEIDQIAAALEHAELMELLDKLLGGNKYRLFLLVWARYADNAEVEAQTRDLNERLRGPSKARYFAQNLMGALMVSETPAAMRFLESKYKLEAYACYHGASAELLRDTKLLPVPDFDAAQPPRYDLGGKTIAVQVTPGPAFALYDESAGKQVRSMPKRGTDPDKTAAATEAFAAYKKAYTEYYKNRALRLQKLNLSGASVSPEIWEKVYLREPVMRQLIEKTVWIDEKENRFLVRSDAVVDVNGQPYSPAGCVHIAHVLELSAEEAAAWRHTLAEYDAEIAPSFEGLWEPVFHFDPTTMLTMLIPIQIGNEEWNAFVRNLRRRGLYVRSKYAEMDLDALPAGVQITDDSTVYLGSSLHLDHTSAGRMHTSLGKMEVCEGANAREVNAVLTELFAAIIRSAITDKDPEYLRDEFLNGFCAEQISYFLDLSIVKRAASCTAYLMEYRNKRFPGYTSDVRFSID